MKRHFSGSRECFFATCCPGFEQFLDQELDQIGAADRLTYPGGVEFSGPLEMMYLSNLRLRTANRVLLRIKAFRCKSYPELFDRCRRIPWEFYLGMEGMAQLSAHSVASRLHHSDHISSSVSAAIARHYNDFGLSVTPGQQGPTIHIRFFQDLCTVSIDTSGEILHKRGYKEYSVSAPIRETIAASILMWHGRTAYPAVVDPCCGSGTLVLEAASMACSALPGAGRDFAFEKFPFFKPARFEKLKTGIDPKAISERFAGFDRDSRAIDASMKNRANLALPCTIDLHVVDALKLQNGWGEKGLIVSNLPYGVRTADTLDSGAKDFHVRFGRKMASEFQGWDFLLVTGSEELLRLLNLKIKRSVVFYNGGISAVCASGRIGFNR
ncbi:MAG: hypothetical protein PHQ23_06435 [Candidatus Wallbacteria bacterium]|nr:hypothetical protein [Candidatus Wallbacteria bacterium]